jgi:hypothetical protein
MIRTDLGGHVFDSRRNTNAPVVCNPDFTGYAKPKDLQEDRRLSGGGPASLLGELD